MGRAGDLGGPAAERESHLRIRRFGRGGGWGAHVRPTTALVDHQRVPRYLPRKLAPAVRSSLGTPADLVLLTTYFDLIRGWTVWGRAVCSPGQLLFTSFSTSWPNWVPSFKFPSIIRIILACFTWNWNRCVWSSDGSAQLNGPREGATSSEIRVLRWVGACSCSHLLLLALRPLSHQERSYPNGGWMHPDNRARIGFQLRSPKYLHDDLNPLPCDYLDAPAEIDI